MPEGDSIHRVARRLQVLVGERLRAEAPHPRGRALGVAARLDGRRLERVEAVGKNLLLRFEGGVTLRSHLRMNGRWRVQPLGTAVRGRPWLVLSGREHEVLLLLARGLSNTEIAAQLVISDGTAKTHVARVLAKLELRDRVQAVIFAYETGLTSPGRVR